MSRFARTLVPLSGPDDSDIVGQILQDARSAYLVRWWDLPGLAQFAPPADASPDSSDNVFGWFSVFAQTSPERYLRLLDQINHYGNRGGKYTDFDSIPEFDAFINWGRPLYGTKANAAWRWCWAMPPYSGRVAATNVGVVYIQMKAEAAARAAQAQGKSAAEVDAARKQGAYEAGAFSLDYQQMSSIDSVQAATADAKEAVAANQRALDLWTTIKKPSDVLIKTGEAAAKGVQDTLSAMGWWFWPVVAVLGYAAIQSKR